MVDKRELVYSLIGKESVSNVVKKADGALEDLGDEFKNTAKAADKLDKEIADTEKSIQALAVAFANTGDDKFFKQIREGERELRKLQKTSKLVSGLGEEMAEQVSVTFSQRLGPLLAKAPLGPAGAIAGSILGAAILPTLGAAIGGAVVGGAGIGGVIGGLVLASKDPAVSAAGKALGKEVSDELEESAQVFVKPALQGIEIIRKGFRTVKPDIDRIFGDSSKFVEPLVTGAVQGVKSIVSGVADAVHKAGPVVDAFGRGFEVIGGAVGDVFTQLSEDADEGASAIDDLTNATKNFILITGDTVHSLAQIKGWLDTLDEKIDETRTKLEDKTGWDITADGMSNTEARAKALADAQAKLRTKHDEAATAARNQVNALTDLGTELQAQSDPMFNLIQKQGDLTVAQKGYNDAVSEHGRKSPEAQEALRKMAQAAIALQIATGNAAGSFDGKLTPAMRTTLTAAGFTEREIKDLETQFKNARAAGNNFAKTYTAHASIKWEKLPSGATYQNGVPSFNFPAKASGGPVRSGQTYLVGEEGPELITPTQNGYVHDANKTSSLMSQSSSSSGGSRGSEITIKLDGADEEFKRFFRSILRMTPDLLVVG